MCKKKMLKKKLTATCVSLYYCSYSLERPYVGGRAARSCLYVCPLTTIYVSSYYYYIYYCICVLMLKARIKMLRSRDAIYVCSYYYICVHFLLYLCPLTTSTCVPSCYRCGVRCCARATPSRPKSQRLSA